MFSCVAGCQQILLIPANIGHRALREDAAINALFYSPITLPFAPPAAASGTPEDLIKPGRAPGHREIELNHSANASMQFILRAGPHNDKSARNEICTTCLWNYPQHTAFE